MPAFVGDNGYRYYAEAQLHTLETILFLREINTPIAEIKQFLDHSSSEDILKIVNRQKEDYVRQINQNEKLLHALKRWKDLISSPPQVSLNCVLLKEFPASPMFATFFKDTADTPISFTEARSTHMAKVYSLCSYKDQLTGYMLSKENFFNRHFLAFDGVITKSDVSQKDGIPSNFARPAGLYTHVYVRGSCIDQSQHVLTCLRKFWEDNGLLPEGDIYCFPVSNHWTAKDQQEYISSFAIRVIPQKNNSLMQP